MDVRNEDGSTWMGKLHMSVSERIRDYFKVRPRQKFFFLCSLVANIIADYGLCILITFLTDHAQLKLVDAVLVTNIQDGATEIFKLFVCYLIDDKTGNFRMLVYSTPIYAIGFGVLIFASSIEAKRTLIIWLALPLLTIGKAGHDISLERISPTRELPEHQDEEGNSQEIRPGKFTINKILWVLVTRQGEFIRHKKLWVSMVARPIMWTLVTIYVTLFVSYGVPYIMDTWLSTFAVCAGVMGISLAPVLLATIFYIPRKPTGSSLTHVFHVMFKIECPSHDNNVNTSDGGTQVPGTINPRLSGPRSCSMQQKEEVKLIKNMIPMLLTFFIYGVMLAIGKTFFIEQANDLKANLGAIHNVPPQVFALIQSIAGYVAPKLYNKTSAIWSKRRKRSSDAAKIVIGMILSVLCCVVATLVEKRRVRLKNECSEYPIPMSVFWLTPQFVIFGAMDGLVDTGITGFFRHRGPSSIKKYAAPLAAFVTGIGIMFSGFIIWLISFLTEENGHKGWIGDSIEETKLDRFFTFMSSVSMANLIFFGIIVACQFSYRTRKLVENAQQMTVDEQGENAQQMTVDEGGENAQKITVDEGGENAQEITVDEGGGTEEEREKAISCSKI